MNNLIEPLQESPASWDARVRADLGRDMRIAGAVIDAIENDRIELFCQPVCSVGDLGEVRYFECLVRLLREDRQTHECPGNFIPSLERLRMMQCLDRHVVTRVIELLKTHPNVHLGANISAQSAVEDEWWESTFLDLAAMPDVARRLVIEITETAPLHAAAGCAFVKRLRNLGCCVAIDDFGAGCGIETGSQIGKADIVKIAGELLAGSDDRGARNEELERLVLLARDIAPYVVLEGIESAQGLEVARDAGVDCVQGFYIGEPHSVAAYVQHEPMCDAGTCDSAGLPGHEISLMPLAQLTDLIMETEMTRDKSLPLTGEAVEWAVKLFEQNAGAVVEPMVCCKLRSYAKLAYVTGLTSSVYGKRSAIAASLRDEMADVMRHGKEHPERSVRLLRCIAAFGRMHGELIVCSFGDGAVAG